MSPNADGLSMSACAVQSKSELEGLCQLLQHHLNALEAAQKPLHALQASRTSSDSGTPLYVACLLSASIAGDKADRSVGENKAFCPCWQGKQMLSGLSASQVTC